MLLWLFLLGVTFSFVIPAINFYLSEKSISYIYYILYIFFSVFWVLFTFVKYDSIVLFNNFNLGFFYNYERIINSIPAIFYYLFLWNYVEKSSRCELYRGLIKYLIILSVMLLPLLTVSDVLKLNFINTEWVTLFAGSIVLFIAIYLGFLLIRDHALIFRIIGFGFLIFLTFILASLIFDIFITEGEFSRNPHKLYLIGMLIELTIINYVLNLTNLEYRSVLNFKNNTLKNQILRSQMNPHFVHNSLNAILYYVQTNHKELSENYLSKFSLLTRLFFEYSRRKDISLKEEIELLNLYLEIEKLRFEDKLNFIICAESTVDVEELFIPSMLLQPIVENSLNHGLFHKEGNGMISINFNQIDAYTLKITIEDDGIGIAKSASIVKKTYGNYQSNSTQVLGERLELLNKCSNLFITHTIEDRSHLNTKNTGTLVTLLFKQKKQQ